MISIHQSSMIVPKNASADYENDQSKSWAEEPQ